MTAEQRSEPLVGASDTWQRVHPLSPMIHMWAVIVAAVAVVLFQQASLLERLREWLVATGIPGIALVPMVLGGTVIAVVLASAVGWILSLPWWRATGWRMDAEEIRVRHGVLSKNLRTARFDRVQSVDLVEPLLARILRLAGVRIETAGGTGSAVTVEYLPREQAEALREVLLARVHGEPVLADRSPSEAAGVAAVAVAETTVVAPIPIGKSIIAAALTGPTVVTLLGVILSMSTPVGIAVLLPTLAGVIPWLWTLLNRSWRFTATSSDGVLGLTFGFSERRRQSVPLERIHGMSISQPMLWRLLDWWKVEVSTAGYGHPEKSGATTAVLPVGSLQQAVEMVALLGPLDIAEVDELVRPDRPVRSSTGSTSSSTSTASGTTRYTSPRSARWVSPLDQSRQGVVLVGEPLRAVICRHGRLRRTSEVIDPSHIQELSYRRGPVHRLLGLASVRLDLVPGVVSMTGRDLSHPAAMELFNHLRQRQLPAPDRHEVEDIVC